MKIIVKTFAAALTFLLLASCSSKKAGLWSDLSGEWAVLSIDGKELKTDTALNEKPFIGFDADGRIFGCAGCNRIMGSIRNENYPASADFTGIGTTMMICPDMETEKEFLDAIEDVVRFYYIDENTIELVNAEEEPEMRLGKR